MTPSSRKLQPDHNMTQSPTVQSQHMESPPTGVKPPTFSEMAQRGANKPSASILLHCAACGLKFYTQKGFSDHATEWQRNPPGRTTAQYRRSNGGVRENASTDDQSCSGDPTKSTAQATLDTNIATIQNDQPTDNTRDALNGTQSKARWCTHCAKNLNTGESLTHHIRTKHNVVVVKEDDGQKHTKVVRFKLEDVADASNCLSTQAYNVLCRVDRSPQDANPIPPGEYNIGASTSTSSDQDEDPIPPGEYNIGASTSTSSPLQWSANRQHFTCEQCGRSEYSYQSLQYELPHMVQAHGHPTASTGHGTTHAGGSKEDGVHGRNCPTGSDPAHHIPSTQAHALPCEGDARHRSRRPSGPGPSTRLRDTCAHSTRSDPRRCSTGAPPTADASRRASQRYTRSCNSWSRMRGKPERARGRVSTVRKLFRTRRVS
ncbi:hypothetical protein TNCV_701701 [Trichonephila clavipes]|nr:hypothetical protein TNCV_701701 [Trichonephila clavipes]